MERSVLCNFAQQSKLIYSPQCYSPASSVDIPFIHKGMSKPLSIFKHPKRQQLMLSEKALTAVIALCLLFERPVKSVVDFANSLGKQSNYIFSSFYKVCFFLLSSICPDTSY